MKLSRLAPLGVLFLSIVLPTFVLPTILSAQKREDFLAIQRDVAQLQDRIRQMQTAQDQKMAVLESMLKQALETSGQTSTAIGALQNAIEQRLGEQQTKVVTPLAVLGAKVDQSTDELRALRENVAELSSRMSSLDNKLADISSAVRILGQPPIAPPAPEGASAPAPPAGMSADSLWLNAFRDYSSAKDELAMTEFTDFLRYFPTAENAPAAQYYVGQLYDRAKQYDDAVLAFDAVLERFPENPKTPDAMYMKGVDLMKATKRTEAGEVFKQFVAKYPSHSLVRNAETHLRTLGLRPAPARR